MFRRLLIAVISLFPLIIHAAETDAPRETLESVVAVVNSDVITRTELDNRLRTVKQQLEQQHAPLPSEATLEKQVLDRMILSSLQLQLADRTGVRVDDDTLNRTIARIAEENKMSLGEFRSALERDGYDFASFREDIRKEVIISRVQQRQIADRIMVSEQEIDNFHSTQKAQGNAGEELRLAHILVAVPDAASPERIRAARERAERQLGELREQILRGADFAELARSKSEDPVSAASGGDLGWTSAGELDPLFQAAGDALKAGEISQPFKSGFGWHIAEVLERREHDDTPNVIRGQARDALRQRKIDEELQSWLSRLRDDAHIENRLK